MSSAQARELFGFYYALGLKHRNTFRERDALARWFPEQVRRYPPIICFGFPTDPEEHIPLVTLGINPSPGEVEKRRVSQNEDPEIQFNEQANYFERGCLGWFERAQLIIQTLSEDLPQEQRATYGGVLGGKRNTIHLDLSPVITRAIDGTQQTGNKLLRALGNARDYADQIGDIAQLADFQTDIDLEFERQTKAPAELRSLLTSGTREILEPLLSELVERHGVKMVVALGGGKRLNEVGLTPEACQEKWPAIRWAFLRSGPSDPRFKDKDEELVAKTRQETVAKMNLRVCLAPTTALAAGEPNGL